MKENKITDFFKKNKTKLIVGAVAMAVAVISTVTIKETTSSAYDDNYKDMKKGIKNCFCYESICDALSDKDIHLNKHTMEFLEDNTINNAMIHIGRIEEKVDVENNGKKLVDEAETVEQQLIDSLKTYIQEELDTDEKITIDTKVRKVYSDNEGYETYIIVGEGNTANYFKPDKDIEDAIDAIISLQRCKRYNSSGEETYDATTKYEEFSKIMKEAILKNAAITNTDFKSNENNTKIKSL